MLGNDSERGGDRVLTELVQRDNASYLPPRLHVKMTGTPSNLQYLVAPAMAAGSVMSTSMIDCLLLHCFRGRPDSVMAIYLLLGLKSKEQQELEARLMLPHQRLMLVDLPPAVRAAAGRRDRAPVTYGALFSQLLTVRRELPLGLYRAANPELGNMAPFVYTAPPSSAPILPTDRVFVVRAAGVSADFQQRQYERMLAAVDKSGSGATA